MIHIRSEEEIELIRESCILVAKTLGEVAGYMKQGIKTSDIDSIAEEFIRDNQAVPGFLGYRGYPNTLCISVNDSVVHGIPSEYSLREGDIVSVDCGVIKNGYYGDSAYTFEIGLVGEETKRLLEVTKMALNKGIESAAAGNRIGDIGFAIQSFAEQNGYSVVRELVGHGVGKKLHEDPQVPNFGRRGKGIKLQEGTVIAIEPMVNMGKKEIKQLDDGWTIKTIDGLPSAHFEHTVVVRKGKAEILSSFEYIIKSDI
ncbi:MAG: type I methionyl aminopeptidase [Bacteroidota bacterium]